MIRVYHPFRLSSLLITLLLLSGIAHAQCPVLFDFYGQPSTNPRWYSCTAGNFSFNLSSPSTWGAYTINWGDGTPNTSGASWGPPTFINHVYPAGVAMYTVTVTEIATGCSVQGTVVMEQATSASIQIPVGGLTQACAPQMMEFINSSTNVSTNTIFTWNFGDGSPVQTFDHTNWLQTIQHTYEVGTVNCETVVTLTAENNCNTIQGGFSTATFNPIRIWDLDDPSISASATLLCYPDTTVTFTNTTHRNCLFQGNIYQRYEYWNFGDYWNLGHDSIIDWTPWPPTFPRTMHYPGIGTYTVQLLDSNFCGIAPASITIQIVPPPVAGITATPSTVCVGQPITFLQQATGGANIYRWNLGNGMGWIPTGPGNITYTYNTPGTYNVGSMVGISGATPGCTDTVWVQVTVLPRPSVSILADQISGCNSFPVQFTGVGSNISSWNWVFDVPPGSFAEQNPPPILYNTPGTHPVTLNVTGNNGCNATTTQNINVYANPVPSFTVTNLCEGDTAQFLDQTPTVAGNPIISWNWDFGDGATSNAQNPQHVYTSTGNFTVTLNVSTAHCSGSSTQILNVQAMPISVPTVNTTEGCTPVSVQFGNNSVNGVSYFWQFGDGTTSNAFAPSHTFTNSTGADITYQVSLTVTNAFGCAHTSTLSVLVKARAVAAFTDNTNPPGCSPFQAVFINNSQNATSYFWNFGNGNTSNLTSPTQLYVNNTPFLGTYPVTLIAYNNNGCNDTLTKNVLVYPLANFDFTISNPEGCSPHTVTMPFISGAQGYNWSFGDGATSTLPMPTHTYQNNTNAPVNYTLTLIGVSAFGCADTSQTQITVYPTPVAQFDTDVIAGCSPLNVQINDLSIQNGATYSWNYGNGLTGTINGNHTHTFINNTNSVVTYTITLNLVSPNGCSSTTTRQIQVYPQVTASFVPQGPFCSPATITYNNTSINANSYSWDFGNGVQSNMTNATGTFTNNSDSILNLNVTLHATSSFGCTSTVVWPLVINPTPIAAFITDVVSGCSPLEISITNQSLYGDSYSWNFDDGTTSANTASSFTHVYTNTGNAPIVRNLNLIVSNDEGCSSNMALPITIYPGIQASFVHPLPQCSPAQISFVNTSTAANYYEWNFGNGQQSNLQNPSVLFTNVSDTTLTLPVSLFVSSLWGCSSTALDTLLIYNKPIADFNTAVSSGCSPLAVDLINLSNYADSYIWNYGNGNSSDNADTLHQEIFVNNGNQLVSYSIQLTALTDEGCSSQLSKTIQVYPMPVADFAQPESYCSPVNVAFVNQSTNASQYLWQFGTGAQSAQTNPTYYYLNASDSTQVYNVILEATSSFGCTATTTKQVTVYHKPNANFMLSESGICRPGPIEIYNLSTAADSFYWQYGDGGTSQNADSIHTHIFAMPQGNSAAYQIQLIAATSFGCTATANGQLTLYPAINAQFATDTIGCSPFTSTFINQSTGASSYNWNFDDGTFGNQPNPTHVYTTDNLNDAVYHAQLIATSSFGCSDTMSRTIHVMHRPVAIANIVNTSGCYPTVAQFANSSIGADSYLWTYGTGETSTNSDSLHTYSYINVTSQLVNYNISLQAFTTYGCSSSAPISISIAPRIEANFFSISQGCTPLNVIFDNISTGGNSYYWNFGDGDVSNEYEPAHTFFNWGTTDTTYQIMLVLQDNFGCADTTISFVTIFPQPQVGFTVTPIQQTWPQATVTLDNNTIGGALNFNWDMDDGTDYYTEEPGSHTYSSWGEYDITLSAGNGSCSASAIQTVIIHPPQPIANFEGPASGCAPLTVQFTNLSQYATSSTWFFGDGGVANANNPIYTYWNPGTYTVTLSITGPGGTSDVMVQEFIIQVYPSATAAFVVTPNQVNVPGQPIYCINLSQNANSYTWNFGDDATSNTVNPVHYYQSEGLYSIELIANNQYNCPDTMFIVDVVRAIGGGSISFPNAFTPNEGGGNGGYYDPMSFDNDIFFPMHKGVTEYQLHIFNKWGELLFESKDVNKGWDGYYRGKLCPQDVYVWKVRAQFIDGQQTVQSGDVTLLIK